MNREDIIRMAREAGINGPLPARQGFKMYANPQRLAVFATLVAAEERKAMMQLFTDPENQPTQHGTVTLEYMQREVAAEREACVKVVETHSPTTTPTWVSYAAAIRARSLPRGQA